MIGVGSDEDCLKYKGPPVLSNAERVEIMKACKWIDEVHGNTSNLFTFEFLDSLNC